MRKHPIERLNYQVAANRLAGKLPTGCLTVRWVLPAPRCSVHVSPSVRAQALASTKGAVAALHASGMKTVKITHESLGRGSFLSPPRRNITFVSGDFNASWDSTHGPIDRKSVV